MSKALTNRQRLHRCYRGQPVDRPMVYSHVGIPDAVLARAPGVRIP